VSAMCRKCLRSAPEEAQRCASCGGMIVRFTDSGEMVEIESAGPESSVRHASGGLPALFSDLEDMYATPDTAAPDTAAHDTAIPNTAAHHTAIPDTAAHDAAARDTGAHDTGATVPDTMPAEAVPDTVQTGTAVSGTSVSGTALSGTAVSPTARAGVTGTAFAESRQISELDTEPTEAGIKAVGAVLLPATQLDDLIAEILTPFGFERQAVAQAPRSEAPAAPPAVPPAVGAAPPAISAPLGIPAAMAPPLPTVPVVQPRESLLPLADPLPPMARVPMPPPPPPAQVLESQASEPIVPPQASPPIVESQASAPIVPPQASAPIVDQTQPAAPPDVRQPATPPGVQPASETGIDLSFAELARDIMSISEQETGPSADPRRSGDQARGGDPSEAAVLAEATTVAEDAVGNASFDLVIGPAKRHGLLRRSKNSVPEMHTEIDELTPPNAPVLDGEGDSTSEPGRRGLRLRIR